MFFTRITNEGSSFTKALRINKNDENSFIGDFDASGKYVYIIWNGASLDGGHVFFIRSANNGASFDNINDFGPSNLPINQLDTISNNVYVVWNDKDGGIIFKASTKNGASFGSTQTLRDSGIVPDIIIRRCCAYSLD